jgi:Transposase
MLQITRYVALDIHKQYILAAAIDAHQCVILKPCRVSIETFPDWVSQTLQATDAVVLEATGSVWDLVDLLVPVVAEVKVAHPALVQLIAAARVKTDVRDTLHLARLLHAGLIPEVWIPPKPIRDLRTLITHRERRAAAPCPSTQSVAKPVTGASDCARGETPLQCSPTLLVGPASPLARGGAARGTRSE